MDHPELGPLHRLGAEVAWVGRTSRGDEIWILADFFDDERLDPDCEALAVRELSDLDGLLDRCAAFLADARGPYLDAWTERRWSVNSLVFSREDEQPTFVVQYLLERDDYNRWLVQVVEGIPTGLRKQ
jgi:hypothetical protein